MRFRLLLLVLLACSPLLTLTLHTAFKDRREAIAECQQHSMELLSAARHDEDRVIDSAKKMVYFLAEKDSGIRSMNPEYAMQSLEQAYRQNPKFSNIGVVAANGEVMSSLFPDRNRLLNRGFLRRIAEKRAWSYSRFPSSKTNHPVIHFGYPIIQQNGMASAVVFAELNLVANAKQPPHSLPYEGATWMQIDRDGNILAHYPKAEVWVGQQLQDPWLVTNAFAQQRSFLQSPGKHRVFYSVEVARSRFSAGAGDVAFILATPRASLFSKADAAMWQSIGALAVAVGIALLLGWVGSKLLILRPVNALVKSSARLAAGDLRVRTGLPPTRDELGKLTLAFDQMAQALETREQERQRSSQKLQALSQKLVEVQESERRQIARELHDEIGQSLTAAEINLQAALRMKGCSGLERRLEDSIRAVERVLEQVHDLSLNLRPSMLDDLGLEPALRWYTHRQAELTGLRAEFRADPLEGRLNPLIETECFRVAQEALTNVVRHAQATSVSVELTKTDGQLELSVRDDGIGFDVNSLRDKAVNGASLGLLSMEERASLAGGGLELRSIPGQGTEVHAWFPLTTSDRPVAFSQLNE